MNSSSGKTYLQGICDASLCTLTISEEIVSFFGLAFVLSFSNYQSSAVEVSHVVSSLSGHEGTSSAYITSLSKSRSCEWVISDASQRIPNMQKDISSIGAIAESRDELTDFLGVVCKFFHLATR